MIELMLRISLVLFTLSIAIVLYRVIRGPSMPDRVIALDTIGVNLISGIAVISILLQTRAFLEAILIIGILSFISTIALSKFIERGVIVEYKRNREFSAVFLILVSSVISVIKRLRNDTFTRCLYAQPCGDKKHDFSCTITLTGAFFYFWAVESFFSVRNHPRNCFRLFNGSCSRASYHPCGLPLKC